MQKKDSVSLRNRVNATVRDIPRSGIRDFFDIVSTMKDVISLGIGEPDFDTPWHVRESTMFALERGVTHYTSNYGYLELRKVLARYVGKKFGAEYNPDDEILITVGVSEALDLALRALITPGDEVLYHEPCYVSYRATILFAQGVPVAVETKPKNGFRLTRAMLEAKVTSKTKVLMLNFPNNPTGAVMGRQDLEDIAAFARERDLIVVTDEIYGELTYDAPHTSIVSLPGMRGLVSRFTHLRYQGFDQFGASIDRTASGFHARVVQHECDHLDGLLYPMRIENMRNFGFSSELFPDTGKRDE